jgi:hypothetical protein
MGRRNATVADTLPEEPEPAGKRRAGAAAG